MEPAVTIQQFNSYSADQFERWLEHGLRAKYSSDPDARYGAFDLRHLDIPLGESHLDTITSFFGRLAPYAQDQFCLALDLLVRRALYGNFPSPAMKDAILLIALVHAENALEAFSPVLGSGPWGELQPSLVYDGLSVLMTFAGTRDAYTAVKELATSRNFPDAYSLDAYLLMTRCLPSSWLEDWWLIRTRVSRVLASIQSARIGSVGERFLQRERAFFGWLADAIPTHDIGQHIWRMKLTPSFAERESDDWLFEGLLGPMGPLSLTLSDVGLIIKDRHTRSRVADVVQPPEFIVTCLARNVTSYEILQQSQSIHLSDKRSGHLRDILPEVVGV